MIEEHPSKDTNRRVAIIDHESYFIGNGFVDLTFFLLYGADPEETSQHFLSFFDFYYHCLIRHGLDPRKLGHKPDGYKERLLALYKESVFFGLLRYFTGFGPFLLQMKDSERLKVKFRNCVRHCKQVFDEVN